MSRYHFPAQDLTLCEIIGVLNGLAMDLWSDMRLSYFVSTQ